MRIEDIKTGDSLQGVEPAAVVSVLAVVPISADAIQLVYKTPDGTLKDRLLGRSDEENIAHATWERPWSFDGAGDAFKRPDPKRGEGGSETPHARSANRRAGKKGGSLAAEQISLMNQQPHAMTLKKQLKQMAGKGAVLGFRGSMTPESLGLIRVDEPEKRLFFMRRWAQGTGDVHIFRWGSYDRNAIFVNFYRAKDGELKAVIGPYDEFPEIDPIAARINLPAWKKELAANRADYERFFASQCEELKDVGDDDYIAAVDDREGT